MKRTLNPDQYNYNHLEKIDNGIWRSYSRSWLGEDTQCDRVKPINGVSTTTFW